MYPSSFYFGPEENAVALGPENLLYRYMDLGPLGANLNGLRIPENLKPSPLGSHLHAGKAGVNRWLGWRPSVRGTAMDPRGCPV